MTDVPFAGAFPPFAGEVPVGDGTYTYTLSAGFADTQTFARGADGLTLLLRGPDNRIIDRRPFPRDILAQASVAATAGLNQLRAAMADYRRACVREDDLSGLGVIN